MKILFSFAWALDATGGAELSLRALAEGLVTRGHAVGIVETAGVPSPQPREHAFGGPVWSLPVPGPARHGRWGPAMFAALARFRDIASHFAPGVVSVQCPAWQSVPIVLACGAPRPWRLEITARGSDLREDLRGSPKLRPWLDRLCTHADAATAVSDALWRDFVREFPVVRDKGGVIHDGVAAAWLNGAASRRDHSVPYVLYVGRLHRQKGVDLLVRAWAELQETNPRAALWLAGSGEAEAELRALAQTLDVARSVRFLGEIAQPDLPALYRGSELLVLPSPNEGLPRVLLEAGACGTICVATRVGGNPEVIEDGVTGFLTEPGSPRALAAALTRALHVPPDVRQRMREAAAGTIRRRFGLERTVAAYEALFRSLLDRSTHQTRYATAPKG